MNAGPSNAQQDFDSLVPATKTSRRGFLVTSLATGFAASVAPTGDLLAQTISTSAAGLTAGEVKIPVADGTMVAYRAMPAGGSNLPTVLVVQEIFGVHEHIKDVCRRFAKEGYCAVAPELFARQGDPTKYTSVPELFANIVSKVPDAQVMSDLDATLAWAAANGGNANRAAITGFCWGGRITWLYAAHNKKLKAGVAWYGRLTGEVNANNPTHPYDVADKLAAPVLGLYGGADTGIPQSTVDEMQTRLGFGSDAAKASKFIVYPGAPHAFHADYRPSYRAAEAQDAWQKAIAWFRTNQL